MVYIDNMKEKDFMQRLKNEDVICFCAGQALTNLCKKYPILSSKILYIVDNFKAGQNILLKDRYIPIVSINDVDEHIKTALLVISSVQYSLDIMNQMDKIEKYNDLSFYIPSLIINYPFLAKQEYCNAKKYSNELQIIPKKIHYCWFGRNEMPEQFQKNIESWKKFCPDYEIIRWDESNYDYTKNKYMYDAYKAKKWGFVSDYARVDVINAHGGIYLDTDVEVIKSFDDLLQFKLFAGYEDEKHINFGLGFGSIQNHYILDELLNMYKNLDFIKPDGSYNLVPCPIYQTDVFKKHGLINDGTTKQYKDFMVFSKEYFSPINLYGFGEITENTYSIHQYAATWLSKEDIQKKKNVIEILNLYKKRIRDYK